MVTTGAALEEPFACTTGNGNSPPERKFAFWPLTVVIVGSARIWSTCLLCRSWMVAPRLSFQLYNMKFSGFENSNVSWSWPRVAFIVEGNCPVVVWPSQFVFPPGLKRLMPNW